MNRVNWVTVVIITILALFVIQIAANLLGFGRYGGWGMMGPGMMGSWGFSPFGGIGMFFMWLVPLGLVILTVVGIAWFVKNAGGGVSSPAHSCPNCKRGVQTDWRVCPYCGATLTS